MKKAFFIPVFALLTTIVFGEGIELNTSAGTYLVSYFYEGKNKGQSRADSTVSLFSGKESKPSSIHWECINYVLNMYQTTTGDTFVLGITPGDYIERYTYRFICEYTSATRYNYWFFEIPNPALPQNQWWKR